MRRVRMTRLVLVGSLAVAVALAVRSSRRGAAHGPVPPPAPVAAAGSQPANLTPQSAELTWEVAPRLPRDLFEPAPLPARRRAPRPQSAAGQPDPIPRVAAPLPRVQILLLDPRRSLALVDNRRVAVGDSVSGYLVVAIEPDGVTFERRGERFTARP